MFIWIWYLQQTIKCSYCRARIGYYLMTILLTTVSLQKRTALCLRLWHIIESTLSHRTQVLADLSQIFIPGHPCYTVGPKWILHCTHWIHSRGATPPSPEDIHSHLLKLKGRILFYIARHLNLLVSSLPARTYSFLYNKRRHTELFCLYCFLSISILWHIFCIQHLWNGLICLWLVH